MNKKNERKSTMLKIAVPVVILMIVVAIWIVKNAESSEGTQTPADSDGTDFALHVTEPIDIEQLKSYGLPIIIDFGADSCLPCIEMAPALEELNEELRGRAIIKFVDMDKYPALLEDYPIIFKPTQVLINADGTPFSPDKSVGIRLNKYARSETGEHTVTTHVGGLDKQQMLDLLTEMGMQ